MNKLSTQVTTLPELKELEKSYFNQIKKSKGEEYRKIFFDLELILEGQKVNQQDLRLRFIGLAKQNSELLKLNQKLSQQLETVEK